MKTKILISLLALFMAVFTLNVSAQVATKKEYKSFEKHDRFLNKQIKGKAIKDARKEAKRLKKEGFTTPVGKLPMDKQLEKSWQAQYELDKNGYPFYLIATSRAVGGNQSSATMQATNLAKLNLAGQIESRVSQLIEAKVASNELDKGEAASINSIVSASKTVISNTLGRVIPLVEIYRILPNNNTEVMVTLGYNTELAMQEALKAVKKDLSGEAGNLMQKLEKMMEEGQ